MGGEECVNLKCDPTDALFLREMYAGIVSAYHMNKTHWNTVRLDGDVLNEDVFSMVDKSYSLTKPKIRKAR
ncbi:hypothetical protein AGMMS49975_25080 [Clostridia bacterium]|nr:hypothetical protein AGMMS49975_25080 [Clostridia bacterium]